MLIGDYIGWLVIIYVECIYVDWWLYMLNAYMLIGDYICRVHICCWWNLLHANWWWIVGVRMYWNIIGVDLWNYMKYVLLLSSPSSHTLFMLSFISIVVGCCGSTLFRVIWRVYKRQGRRPRRWKKFGITHSRVGLVTLYVSRRSHVCSWAWCAWWLLWLELRACVIIVESIMCMIIYARHC